MKCRTMTFLAGLLCGAVLFGSATAIAAGITAEPAWSPIYVDGLQVQMTAFNHTVVNAADGSQWYQIASGDAMGDFYPTPAFTGDASKTAQVAEAFPSIPAGTMLRQVDTGVLEASTPDGGNSLWYSSAFYQEPDAPHETIQGSNGLYNGSQDPDHPSQKDREHGRIMKRRERRKAPWHEQHTARSSKQS